MFHETQFLDVFGCSMASKPNLFCWESPTSKRLDISGSMARLLPPWMAGAVAVASPWGCGLENTNWERLGMAAVGGCAGVIWWAWFSPRKPLAKEVSDVWLGWVCCILCIPEGKLWGYNKLERIPKWTSNWNSADDKVYKALDQQAAHIVAIKQVSLGGLHSGDISFLARHGFLLPVLLSSSFSGPQWVEI